MADLKTATTGYPSAVDTYTEWADNTDDVVAESVNNALSAIIAIEGELGPSVKGSSSTVAARLAVCLAQNGALQSGTSYPVSPTPTGGQLFVRTDFSPWRLYMYDGTSAQWIRIESITDHGVLTGLSDDDHTQYVHNTTARTVSANHTLSGNLTLSGSNTITGTNTFSGSGALAGTVTGTPTFSGNVIFSGTPNFSHATGVSPFTATSTTKVTNLNVDKLDDSDASATPGATTIPIADGSGKLAAGWGGSASTLATLDSNTRLVEAANKISDGTSTIKFKILSIGDWDMNTLTPKSVAHGLTRSNIRNITALVINDSNTYTADFSYGYGGSGINIDNTYVYLDVVVGSLFQTDAEWDNDGAPYNRGYITIWYVE